MAERPAESNWIHDGLELTEYRELAWFELDIALERGPSALQRPEEPLGNGVIATATAGPPLQRPRQRAAGRHPARVHPDLAGAESPMRKAANPRRNTGAISSSNNHLIRCHSSHQTHPKPLSLPGPAQARSPKKGAELPPSLDLPWQERLLGSGEATPSAAGLPRLHAHRPVSKAAQTSG